MSRLRALVLWAVAAALAPGCAAHRQAAAAVRVQVALARELAQRGETAAAFDAVDAACREPPRDGAACALRGALLAERGLLDQAEADLRDAVRLAPELAEGHAALAIVYERLRRPEDAELEHRRAVQLAPRSGRYLNNLGYALLVHGKGAEALAVLEQAAREDPMDRRIRNNLGFARARAADFGRAAAEFELGGAPAEARNNLGYAYELAGNLAQARLQYREALRLDPVLAAARRNLARLDGAPSTAVPSSLPAGAGDADRPTGGLP